MNPWIPAALVLGLASSAHCLGMCGPIALAVPSARPTSAGRLLDTLILNSGRVVTYVALGALFGLFGRGLEVADLQRMLSIAMGAFLLLFLLWPRVTVLPGPSGGVHRALASFRSFFAKRLSRISPMGLFTSGVLNGLLPCGMVYMALAMALMQDGAWHGALFMGLFGLGTWPALIALRMGKGLLGDRARSVLRRISPVLAGVLALLFILRGMGLGIPYVSPVIDGPPVGVQACE